MSSVSERIFHLKMIIQEAAKRVSRSPDSIKFLLATKTVSKEKIKEALETGVHDFGENRIQEFLSKKKELPSDIQWHFIGRLQTNKVKYLLQGVQEGELRPPLLHSLDRLELAQEIERQARQKKLKQVPCLIQINSSGEKSKAGFEPAEVPDFVAGMGKDSPIQIHGLMTIGPLTEDKNQIRKAFRTVKNMQKELERSFPEKDWATLSMGMSSDYEIAIEEGATLLRIGSAVFGTRGE